MLALSTLILLAPLSIGFGGHHARTAGCCDVCGVEKAAVLADIQVLKTCPRRRLRDHAAHALRKFDWRCHPEAALALAESLLRDCEEEVREEAAQSLTRMAPCLPEVHAALRKAADCDPDHSTRKWARKALKSLGNRCVSDCIVCGPAAVEVVVPTPEPAPLIEPAPIPVEPAPPTELPSPLPGASPFDSSPPVPEAEPPLTAPLSERRRPGPILFRLGRRLPSRSDR